MQVIPKRMFSSVFRPSTLDRFFPSVTPFFSSAKYYSCPKEGVPSVEQNKTHWFVKTYLPDVSEENFKMDVNDKKLNLQWKDLKTIKYQGRTYHSSEPHEKQFEIPDGINKEDINVD
mmetsp:Transcript_5376/g.8089  ORF Transcript_5376/g.8089 Transcript_5376/m.8089 type:complete len:117 (+) Transcript_5376:24-374(+)